MNTYSHSTQYLNEEVIKVMTKRELRIMIMEEVLNALDEKESRTSNSALDTLISEGWHQKFQEKMKDESFAKKAKQEFDALYESTDLKHIHHELSSKIPTFAKNYEDAKKLMGEALTPSVDLLNEGEAMEMIKAGGKTLLWTAALAGLAGIGIDQFGASVGITDPSLLGKLVAGFIAAAGGLSGVAAMAAGGAKGLISKFKTYAQKAQAGADQKAQAGAQTEAEPTI
jgi:hypothetical protein